MSIKNNIKGNITLHANETCLLYFVYFIETLTFTIIITILVLTFNILLYLIKKLFKKIMFRDLIMFRFNNVEEFVILIIMNIMMFY